MDSVRLQKTEKWIFYFMGGFALFSSLSIAVGNIFLSLTLAAFAYRLFLKHDDVTRILHIDHGITLVLAGVMGTAILSALFSGQAIKGLRLFGDYYGYRMLGLYVVLIAVREKHRLWVLAELAAVSFLLNNLNCIWFGILRPGYRSGGFMDAIMSTAGVLSMGTVAFLLLGLYFHGLRERIISWGFFLVALAALLYNGTRGAWLAVAIVAPIAAYFVVRDKKKYFAAGLAAVILLGGLFISRPALQSRAESITDTHYQSNTERILLWTSAYHMFQDHPMLGVGFSKFEQAYKTQYISPKAKEPGLGHAHSNVMQMLGERGALGCAAFLAMWGYFVYFGLHGWKKEKDIAFLLFFSIVMGLMLQGLTEYNMGNSVVTKLFWFLLGLCLQWIHLSRREMVK